MHGQFPEHLDAFHIRFRHGGRTGNLSRYRLGRPMVPRKRVVERTHGHPVNDQLLYVLGSASCVNAWFRRQRLVPSENLQAICPPILREQEPTVTVEPRLKTNCATPLRRLHFITSI